MAKGLAPGNYVLLNATPKNLKGALGGKGIKKEEPTKKPTAQPEKTKYGRDRRIIMTAGFSLAAAAPAVVIAGVVSEQIYLSFITFFVAGAVKITFQDGSRSISGPMNFGDEDEPRGAVLDHSRSPIVISPGNSFGIYPSTNKGVAGYCTYYTLPEPES
jgi:hypothetical protein